MFAYGIKIVYLEKETSTRTSVVLFTVQALNYSGACIVAIEEWKSKIELPEDRIHSLNVVRLDP